MEKLDPPEDYDIIYLGYHTSHNHENYNNVLNRCDRIYGTFAMLISYKGAQKLVNEMKIFKPLKWALDTAYFYQLKKQIIKYSFKTKLVKHLIEMKSDITIT